MIIARLLAHNSREEAIPLKRSIFLTLLCLALALMLTGCASNADTEPSPSAAITTPGMNPANTNMPDASTQLMPTDNGGNGILSDILPGGENTQIANAEDALNASKALREAVEKLTEIDSAVAVAVGNTALVGVTFDSSYQGGIDDRLRGMVLDRARAVHPGLQSIAVTDDEKARSEIASLYQMLQSGSPYTTVKANADTLADGMDMYKE